MEVSDEVIARLLQGGLSPTTVVHLFELPDARVAEVAARTTGFQPATVDDIQTAMRALTLRVIDETMVMLDEGSPVQKQKVLTNMFAKVINVVTAKDEGGVAQLREEMTDLFRAITKQQGEDDG